MKNQDFKISFKVVWFLVIANILFTTLGTVAKLNHWDYPNFLLTFGVMLYFSSWIIILSDMANTRIYNKTFWIISMLVFPLIAMIVYMFRRKSLLRLDENY